MLVNPLPEIQQHDLELLDKSEDIGFDLILAEAGVTKPSSVAASPVLSKILSDKGASLSDIAESVVRLMINGEKDSDRHKATELAARLHGLLKEAGNGNQASPVVNITINSEKNNSKDVMKILVPNTEEV